MARHRKPGALGTFTVHAPADYRPSHERVGVWMDRVTGRTTDLVFVPPEDLVFLPTDLASQVTAMHPHGDCS